MSRAQIAAFFAAVPVLYWPVLCLELVKLRLWAQGVEKEGWRYIRVSVDGYGRLYADVVPTHEDEYERCDWPPTLAEALAKLSLPVIPESAPRLSGTQRRMPWSLPGWATVRCAPGTTALHAPARAPPILLDPSHPSASVAARFMRAAHL